QLGHVAPLLLYRESVELLGSVAPAIDFEARPVGSRGSVKRDRRLHVFDTACDRVLVLASNQKSSTANFEVAPIERSPAAFFEAFFQIRKRNLVQVLARHDPVQADSFADLTRDLKHALLNGGYQDRYVGVGLGGR